jgi:outer membrane protein assembly factor BamA
MPQKLIPVLSLALLGMVFPAHAQKFIPKTIQFKGDPEYSTEELLSAAGLKGGETLDYAGMNERSKRLMDTGMFASLMFKFDGQDLIFQMTPADQLVPVHLDNLPITSGADLDAKLHKQFPLYHGKVPSEGGLLDQVRGALESMLGAEGIKATVLAAPGADNRTHHLKAMHFSLANPPVEVNVKEFTGASKELEEKLHAIALEAAKIPFDTDSSAGNIEQAFTIFYQDRGYAGVKVRADRAGNAIVDATGIIVPFVVKIEEGRVYKVGTIHVPDGTPMTPAEIAKEIAISPSGPVQGVRVRTVWSMIAQRYRAKGYLDCKITPTPQFDDAGGTVNYDVAIEPGPVYHLAFVKFENVSDELRTLLIRNWQMLPGDVFNESYVSNFIATAQQNDPVLRRTLANVKTSFNAMADPQTHDVNVVVRLDKR